MVAKKERRMKEKEKYLRKEQIISCLNLEERRVKESRNDIKEAWSKIGAKVRMSFRGHFEDISLFYLSFLSTFTFHNISRRTYFLQILAPD